MTDFSAVLRRLRREAKLTQPQLAEKLGISRSAVGMYESGDREPDLTTLCAIADVFSVPLDILLGRRQQPAASQLKNALFGDEAADDALLDDVLAYARFLHSRKK